MFNGIGIMFAVRNKKLQSRQQFQFQVEQGALRLKTERNVRLYNTELKNTNKKISALKQLIDRRKNVFN